MNDLNLQILELNPNKVYHVAVECGSMSRDLILEHIKNVKQIFDKNGIKAICSAMVDGVHNVTITELPMLNKND